MHLVIGGFAQGKLKYVTEKYEKHFVIQAQELGREILLTSQLSYDLFRSYLRKNHWNENESEVLILNQVHLLIKMLLPSFGMEKTGEFLLQLVRENESCVFVSDEIGNGIVPMDREERQYREATGRILTKIAAKASSVERIICGLPQTIK